MLVLNYKITHCLSNTKTDMIVVLPNYVMSVQCKDIHDSGIAKSHNNCAMKR